MIPDYIYSKASKDLGLSKNLVKAVYKEYWNFIRHTIEQLNLKDNLSEEEFNTLRTNINIPSIGKLVCPYSRYKNVKNTLKYIKNLKEKLKEDEETIKS